MIIIVMRCTEHSFDDKRRQREREREVNKSETRTQMKEEKIN